VAAGATPEACLGRRTRKAPGSDSKISGASISMASPSMAISTAVPESTRILGASHSSQPWKLRILPWADQEDQQYQQQYAQQQAYAKQQAPPAPPVDTISQLKELAELKTQGILTEEEFQAQKAKLLAT
jgi:Short C-terminal domain